MTRMTANSSRVFQGASDGEACRKGVKAGLSSLDDAVDHTPVLVYIDTSILYDRHDGLQTTTSKSGSIDLHRGCLKPTQRRAGDSILNSEVSINSFQKRNFRLKHLKRWSVGPSTAYNIVETIYS